MIRLDHHTRSAAVGVAALALTTLAACSVRDTFLSPQQPGTILPGDISGAGVAGAEAIRVGALGRFQQLTPGGGNGNQTEATLLGDLLGDVWKSGDTFSQHNETDQRIVQTNNSVLSTAYSDLTRSRRTRSLRSPSSISSWATRRCCWPSCSATAHPSVKRMATSSRSARR